MRGLFTLLLLALLTLGVVGCGPDASDSPEFRGDESMDPSAPANIPSLSQDTRAAPADAGGAPAADPGAAKTTP